MKEEDLPGIRPPPESVSLEKAEKLHQNGQDIIVERGKVRIMPSRIRILPKETKKGEKVIPFPEEKK